MDTQTRSQYAEAGRKKLEEFRRKKAAEKAAVEQAAAAPSTSIASPPTAAPSSTAAAAAGKEEHEPTAKPIDLSEELATHTSTPFHGETSIETTAMEPPSWPSPTPGGAAAAATIEPPPQQSSLYQPYNPLQSEKELEHHIDEQLLPPLAPSAILIQGAAEDDVSSFSSYTNLLADPSLPPQPLFEPSAVGGAAADEVNHHYSSFLPSMNLDSTQNNLSTSNRTYLNSNTTTAATYLNPIGTGVTRTTNTTQQDEEEREETILKQQQQEQESSSSPPSRSRSPVRSPSPTPSSPTTTTTTTASERLAAHKVPRDFKELQHHIGELTEEKFTLQRCLEQQTALADRLVAENEALAMQVNVSGRAVEEAKQEVEFRRNEVARARADIATAMAERDAYEMGAREASERAKTLAIEVVALEEKVLRMKSEQMKLLSEKEKAGKNESIDKNGKGGGGDAGIGDKNSSNAAAAVAVIAAERKVEMVSTQLHASNRQLQEMQRERIESQQELARLLVEIEELKEARGKERQDHVAALDIAAAARIEAETSRHMAAREGGEEEQPQQQQEMSTITRASSSGRNEEFKNNNDNISIKKEALLPPASALIAGEAMVEAEKIVSKQKEEEEEGVPAEIRALLPPAVWTPGAQGLDPSVNDLVERIYEVVGLLESEKNEAAAVLAAQRQTNIALQARLEALQASQELAIQEQARSV